jgi:hypothetical protein
VSYRNLLNIKRLAYLNPHEEIDVERFIESEIARLHGQGTAQVASEARMQSGGAPKG